MTCHVSEFVSEPTKNFHHLSFVEKFASKAYKRVQLFLITDGWIRNERGLSELLRYMTTVLTSGIDFEMENLLEVLEKNR